MKKVIRLFLLVVFVASAAVLTGGPFVSAQHSNLPDRPFVVPTAQMPDGTGQQGGTITIDDIDNPKTFNPITQNEASSSAVTTLLNASLVDNTGKATAAESVDVSADQTSLTVTLRQGLKFSDGSPVTADDFVFTLQNIIFNSAINSTQKDAWQVNGQFPTVQTSA